MTFEDLKKAMKDNFGIVRLADIAREFNVSPQVINNWKTRDQIPYKYIKKYNELIVEKNQLLQKDNKYVWPNPFLSSERSNDEDDISITEYFFSFLKYLITYKYAVGLAIFISISYSYINLRFIAEPLYQTEATILPIGSGQNGNISGLASQFGINMLEKGDVVDLSSSKLVPEILNSRKLSRSVLNYKFDTRKFGKQKD